MQKYNRPIVVCESGTASRIGLEDNSLRDMGYSEKDIAEERQKEAANTQPATNGVAVHDCVDPMHLRQAGHNHAIEAIYSDGASWFAANSEYATQVFFCPFCGERLLV